MSDSATTETTPEHEPAQLAIPRPATPATPADPGAGVWGADPDAHLQRVTHIATLLTSIIEDRKLYKAIGGADRKHVLVDGWTLLGSMVQVRHVVAWTRQIPDEATGMFRPPTTEIRPVTSHSAYCTNGATNRDNKATHPQTDGCKTYTKEKPVVTDPGLGGWEARVEVFDMSDRMIGAAESECRWSEPTWADRDSYALRSMAQTRATGKALRQPLGFIVTLAGFQATPAEEMPTHLDADAGDADTYTGPRCPTCDSPVWDNTAENAARAERGQNRMPPYKCKNKRCTGGDGGQPWISWDENFYRPEDFTNAAKDHVWHAIHAKPAGWEARYTPDVELPPERATLLDIGHDPTIDNDQRNKARAGILWLHIGDLLNLAPGEPLDRDTAEWIKYLANAALDHPEAPWTDVEDHASSRRDDARDSMADGSPY